MKNILLMTTFLMTIASTSAFAHHPAANIVDPEIYAMIDENVADTPHADLSFEEMGRDMEEVDPAMEAREEMDAVANEDRSPMLDNADIGMQANESTDISMESEDAMDTINLLDNVVTALSE